MDKALAIVTMMEMMMMMMAAHPLPPQTVVFKFMPNAKFYPYATYLSYHNAWLSGICIPHTSQKPYTKKGISQSFDPPQGAVICNGSRFAHAN
jgi:hypothetical protein